MEAEYALERRDFVPSGYNWICSRANPLRGAHQRVEQALRVGSSPARCQKLLRKALVRYRCSSIRMFGSPQMSFPRSACSHRWRNRALRRHTPLWCSVERRTPQLDHTFASSSWTGGSSDAEYHDWRFLRDGEGRVCSRLIGDGVWTRGKVTAVRVKELSSALQIICVAHGRIHHGTLSRRNHEMAWLAQNMEMGGPSFSSHWLMPRTPERPLTMTLITSTSMHNDAPTVQGRSWARS